MVNDKRLCSYKMVLQEPAHLLLTFPAVAMAATLIRAPLSKQVFQQKPSISLTQTSVRMGSTSVFGSWAFYLLCIKKAAAPRVNVIRAEQ